MIQDTTRKAAPSSLEIRAPDQVMRSPLPRLKRPELPFTLHVDELEPQSTTLEDIDSLGRLYPELRNFLLKQAIIQGALAADKVEFERRKTLGRLFTDLKLYNEMEAALRLNNARYGTPNNPLRPPPMPNQINLVDVLPAISNLLHALGLK